MSPRLPRPLARRLDRLARRAHRFHRFAHHPLCGAYAPELLRIGSRTRICRGCAYALLGSASGAVIGAGAAWFATAHAHSGAASLFGMALAGSSWLIARAPRRGALRTSKLYTRFLPFLGLGLACTAALLGRGGALALGVAGSGLGATSLALAAYRSRGPDRSPCERCPERTARVCSGYRPIVQRERAFVRLSGRIIAGAGG